MADLLCTSSSAALILIFTFYFQTNYMEWKHSFPFLDEDAETQELNESLQFS